MIFAADLKLSSNCREFSASSGFIARLDFGELARWGRMEEKILDSEILDFREQSPNI
jgi:hypothetical protein